MASILLLIAVSRSFLNAHTPGFKVPLQQDGISSALQPRSNSSMLNNNRALWDIIWSCLATIFACTWVAVHPNIPSLKEDWKSRLRARLKMMAYAWIAPECVTMWAMRQWLSARKLSMQYNESRGIPGDSRSWIRSTWDSFFPSWDGDEARQYQRWSLTHGFFAQMGGYVVFRGDKPCWTLFIEDADMERDFRLVPYYTEDELMDRSKGDVLSKSVALLQTTWFGIQYLTRICYQLPRTELETMTLAFAMLNIVTYILWLHKPLNVQCPIRVYESPSHAPQPREQPTPRTIQLKETSKGKFQDQPSIPPLTHEKLPRSICCHKELLDAHQWIHNYSPNATSYHSLNSTSSATLTLETQNHGCPTKNADNYWSREVTIGCSSDTDTQKYGTPWRPIAMSWCPGSKELPLDKNTHATLQLPRFDVAGTVKWCRRFQWNRSCAFWITLVVDGGWYSVNLIADDKIQLSSGISNHSPLSVQFYLPLFLRSLPWRAQTYFVFPLLSPYVALAFFYKLFVLKNFIVLLAPLSAMIGTSRSTPSSDPHYPLRAPPFYTGPLTARFDVRLRLRVRYATLFLTSIFGAIHVLGWYAHFPSTAERTLWRFSSISMCSTPPAVALWIMYHRASFSRLLFMGGTAPSCLASTPDVFPFIRFLSRVSLPMYMIGRISLIVLAFTTLRDQPEGAFLITPWTSAIPHL